MGTIRNASAEAFHRAFHGFEPPTENGIPLMPIRRSYDYLAPKLAMLGRNLPPPPPVPVVDAQAPSEVQRHMDLDEERAFTRSLMAAMDMDLGGS